jgi:hypothetical protein
MEIVVNPKTVSAKLSLVPASKSSSVSPSPLSVVSPAALSSSRWQSLVPSASRPSAFASFKASPFARMSDAELLARLDELVRLATRGDRHAIGAIALAFTGDFLAEANAVLRNEHDAADVVQDFFLALVEGKIEGNIALLPGGARSFLLDVVRRMARKRRGELRRLL